VKVIGDIPIMAWVFINQGKNLKGRSFRSDLSSISHNKLQFKKCSW